MRTSRRPITWIALLAGTGIVISLSDPTVAPAAWAAVILVVLAWLGAGIVGRLAAVRSERAGRFERALEVADRRMERPADLVRMERSLAWRTYSTTEFDIRVRPVLCRLADYKLLERHGVDLAREPDRAHDLLPERLRAFLTEERSAPRPKDRIDAAEIALLVREIEAI